MKNFRIRFIKESDIVQPASVSADTTQDEMNKQDDELQSDALIANTTPTIQEQDVDSMEDKDVMNYVYFNAPQDIDDATRNALFNRADNIRQKQMNGNMTPKDQEEFTKGVIAAAAQKKNKTTMGESVDFHDTSIEAFLKGNCKPQGQMGGFVWNGNDMFEEIDDLYEKPERVSYFHKWIGCIDRNTKTIYLNNEASTIIFNRIITVGRRLKWNLRKTENSRKPIFVGYDDDEQVMGEAYTSGRIDTFNEPSWEDMEGHYDDDDLNDEYSSERVPSIEELRQSNDELKRSTLLEELKESIADKIDDLTNGEFNYNRIYNAVDKYINNAYKKYNTEEIEKYSRVYSGKVDFFAKIILTKYKK